MANIALKHRVSMPLNQERLTVASFVSPDKERALKNYKLNEIAYERFEDYVTVEVSKVYPLKSNS